MQRGKGAYVYHSRSRQAGNRETADDSRSINWRSAIIPWNTGLKRQIGLGYMETKLSRAGDPKDEYKVIGQGISVYAGGKEMRTGREGLTTSDGETSYS